MYIYAEGPENSQKASQDLGSATKPDDVNGVTKTSRWDRKGPEEFQGISENTIHSLCQWPLWYG